MATVTGGMRPKRPTESSVTTFPSKVDKRTLMDADNASALNDPIVKKKKGPPPPSR